VKDENIKYMKSMQ